MNLVIESLTAFGELILNPMFYWIILLVILPSDHRIQLEKKFFNQQVFGMRAELRQTLYLSIVRSEEHTSELQSRGHLVCRLLLEKKNKQKTTHKPNYSKR